jgi:hypothetical protein
MGLTLLDSSLTLDKNRPKDLKDMVSVLRYYASFLLDTVLEHAKCLVLLYDQYDDANDRMAIMFP